MKIKPFLSINFCYKCGCPVPRLGVSIRTGVGNISTSTPFICPKCKTGIVTLKVIQSKFGGEFKFFDCSQERCDWDGGRYYSDIKFYHT